MSTQSQHLITGTAGGLNLGTWDKRTGGETRADAKKKRAGGSSQQKVYRARPDTGEVKISRTYELERDVALAHQLRAMVGKAPMSVTDQPLDVNDVPWGPPTTWSGLLTGISIPDADAESDDLGDIELTMIVTGVA